MIVLAFMLSVAQQPVDCPPKGSAARDRVKLAGEICNDEPTETIRPKPAYISRPISAADKAKIIAAADMVLFDGPSARWQWGYRKDPDIYCGFVNGKNRLGAFVGWKPFYWYKSRFEIITENGDVFYETICSVSGYIEKPDWLKGK